MHASNRAGTFARSTDIIKPTLPGTPCTVYHSYADDLPCQSCIWHGLEFCCTLFIGITLVSDQIILRLTSFTIKIVEKNKNTYFIVKHFFSKNGAIYNTITWCVAQADRALVIWHMSNDAIKVPSGCQIINSIIFSTFHFILINSTWSGKILCVEMKTGNLHNAVCVIMICLAALYKYRGHEWMNSLFFPCIAQK